jgi:thiol-disulfide isomerase/thioredoxin
MQFFLNNKKAKGLLGILVCSAGLMSGQAAVAESGHAARPKVIEFYASWCEPCRRLKTTMDCAQSKYGSDVDFVRYDVDDPACRNAVKKYDVCPIPTVVFVDARGQVSDYFIGCTEARVIDKGFNKVALARADAANADGILH